MTSIEASDQTFMSRWGLEVELRKMKRNLDLGLNPLDFLTINWKQYFNWNLLIFIFLYRSVHWKHIYFVFCLGLSTGWLLCPLFSLTADPISGHLLCPASSLRPRPLSCPQRGWGQTDTRHRTTASHHSLALSPSLYPTSPSIPASQNIQITHASKNIWPKFWCIFADYIRIIDKARLSPYIQNPNSKQPSRAPRLTSQTRRFYAPLSFHSIYPLLE